MYSRALKRRKFGVFQGLPNPQLKGSLALHSRFTTVKQNSASAPAPIIVTFWSKVPSIYKKYLESWVMCL